MNAPIGSSASIGLKETFGAKLRRLADAAATSNLVTNLPWAPEPAWAASTAYNKGAVVSNGGNLYQCLNGATSGSTAPTGTNTTAGVYDGASSTGCLWQYMGGVAVAIADPNAPAITIGSTPAALSNNWQAYNITWPYRFYGGYSTQYAGFLAQLQTFTPYASASPTTNGIRIAFMTDAPTFAINFGNDSVAMYRLSIDGRYIRSCGFAAGSNVIIVDFSAVNGRKPRLVTVDCSADQNGIPSFYSVHTSPQDMVWAPPVADDVRGVFITDSMGAGSSSYGPFINGNALHRRLGDILGINDMWGFSIGGTGYANGSATAYTYAQRIPEALTRTPDIWFLYGSTNDESYSSTTQAAVAATLQAIRNGGSTAPIVVFGVWSLGGALAQENLVKAGVTAAADPLGKTFFVPIATDPNLPWITGSWNNTGLAGPSSTNNQAEYICSDGIHPPDLGTLYTAQRMATAVKSQVYRLLA